MGNQATGVESWGAKDGVLEDLVTDEGCWRWHEIWELVKAGKPRGQRTAVSACRAVQGGACCSHRGGRWVVLLVPAL